MAHSKMSPKRKVNVKGQPHSLAYINKDEARMLRRMGGSGKPGPSGIPTYFPNTMDPGEAAEAGFTDSFDGSYSGGNDDDGGYQRTIQQPVAPKAAPQPSELEKGRTDLQARIDKLTAYSEKKDTNFINRYAAKANVAAAQRVASKLDEKGAIAIRNKAGEVVGAMHDGPFGLGKVYSGRSLSAKDYAGPAEFAQNVVMDDGGGVSDDEKNIRGGAKDDTPKEILNGKMPDAPESGEGGDATDDAKRRSKMGKESTVSTTSQGLLGSAKTRNRSLMSGLIS